MARGIHKVNPILFRIGMNKTWDSSWFASDRRNYVNWLKQDLKIREVVNKALRNAGVARILISRIPKKVVLEVHVAKPGVAIGRNGVGITNLRKEIEKKFRVNCDINLVEVKNPDANAQLVANIIAFQCSNRVVPKLAIQKAIDAAKEVKGVKGIAIWIRGRIKGVDQTRIEKYSWGFVPRHTIRADIDYAFAEAHVPRAGIHGIKVWINKGKKLSY